ncbi:MAG: transposase [Fibrobacterota bacterium]|nr:transposase [Fibrobacterota bacterium]QQS03253.1 MAG: transposase [Fibrobacterota bacterium]
MKTPHVRACVELGPYVVMPDHLHGLIHLMDGSANLGVIVNQVKSNATKRIRALLDPQFAWQARYHDRIIRDEAEFDRICGYIWENPWRWT